MYYVCLARIFETVPAFPSCVLSVNGPCIGPVAATMYIVGIAPVCLSAIDQDSESSLSMSIWILSLWRDRSIEIYGLSILNVRWRVNCKYAHQHVTVLWTSDSETHHIDHCHNVWLSMFLSRLLSLKLAFIAHKHVVQYWAFNYCGHLLIDWRNSFTGWTPNYR